MAQKNLDGYGSIVFIAGSSKEPRKEKGDECLRYGEMIYRLYVFVARNFGEIYVANWGSFLELEAKLPICLLCVIPKVARWIWSESVGSGNHS